METGELEWLMRDEPRFLGVFAANTLPEPSRLEELISPQTSSPYCLIVNTDPLGRPGEHWLALYFTSPYRFEFFDSYALPLQLYPRIAHTLRSAEFTHASPFAIQHPSSDFCGHYCIFYLKLRLAGISTEKILSRFSPSDLRSNDAFVSHFICSKLKFCARSASCKGIQCPSSSSTRVRYKQQSCECRNKFFI